MTLGKFLNTFRYQGKEFYKGYINYYVDSTSINKFDKLASPRIFEQRLAMLLAEVSAPDNCLREAMMGSRGCPKRAPSERDAATN